ncbi:MAG: O-antigen ligase family protein [Candidatus Sedimenticola sp. (ex Thyasira tokunagai)]
MNDLSVENKGLLVLFSLVILSLPLKNAIYQISYGLFALLFLFTIIRLANYRLFQENIRFTVLFALILLSMTISNYFGVEGDERWELLLKFLFRYVLLFFAVLYLLKERVVSMNFVLLLIVASFSIQAFDGIYQQYTGYDFFVNRKIVGNRLLAATFSSNALGFLLFVNVSILLYCFIAAVQKGRGPLVIAAYSPLICVSAYVLLHTSSRASWVAATVFLVIFVALNFRRLNIKSYTAIAVFVLAVALYIISDDSVFSRFSTLVAGQSPIRIDIWLFSIEQFLLAPVFGYGLNSYAVLGGPHPNIHMPHNIVFEILIFLGLTGLVLFSAFFISVFMSSISVFKQYRLLGSFLMAIFAAVLVGYLFDHSITDSKITNTVLFTIMAVIVNAGHGAVKRMNGRVTS